MARTKDQQQPDTPLYPKNVNFIIAGRMARVPEGKTRRALQPSDLDIITDPIERTFAKSAMEVGLVVYPGPCIIAPEPVEDDKGKRIKRVTNPDYEVLKLGKKTTYRAIVEVTKSEHMTPQKKSQLRVAEAAGVTNYYQLRGPMVQELPHLHPTIRRRTLINTLGLKKKK